jgi:hypothetical protein
VSTIEIVSTDRKRADVFLGLMQQMEFFSLGRAWRNVDDDEFFWEPSPHTWSIRRRAHCHTPTPFGAGDWVADFGREPNPAPMTSIAWLMWHIGTLPSRLSEVDFLDGDHTVASGWTSPYLTHHPIFATAHHASTAFWAGWDALRAALLEAADEQLESTSPDYTYAHAPMSGGLCALGPPGLERPATFVIARALNEIAHHSAQICTLRDLYAHAHRTH